jgi:hypothetical protein
VRHLLGERGRAEHAVGEAEDRVAVALVEREDGRLVAATVYRPLKPLREKESKK